MLNTFKLGAKYPVYTGQVKAKIDAASEDGKVLCPAYATDVELIADKEGFQRYFKDGAWHYVVDNVGKEYWDEDGTRYTIKELGEEVPESALLEPPVIPQTSTELSTTARTKRDQLLDEVSKRYDRYASESRLGLETTDSIEALDTYAQALRDITNQEVFPTEIEWPPMP